MNDEKVDVATLIEVTESFLANVNSRLANTDYACFPSSHTFKDKNAFLTLTVYNKNTVSDVQEHHTLNPRVKVISFSTQGKTVLLGQCHLAAGDGFENEREQEIVSVINAMDDNQKPS